MNAMPDRSGPVGSQTGVWDGAWRWGERGKQPDEGTESNWAARGIGMVFQTERLILREFSRDDWRAVHLYASDAAVVQFMDWGPNTEEETRGFLLRVMAAQTESPRQVYELAITRGEDGRLIGGVSLHREAHFQAALGYCLNRRFWGQGFAAEAAQALCGYGFRELGLHRIFATCRPGNVASARVMEKIGMQREGVLREHFWAKAHWQNSFLYSVLADEWANGG